MPFKRLYKVIIAGGYIFALGISFSFFASAASTTIGELETKLDTLRQKDAELQKKAQGFRSLVKQTKKEIVGIKTEISGLTYQINSLETEIERTQNDVELVALQIEKLGLEIIKTLDEIGVAKDQTADVIRRLYQSEQVSMAEIVLTGNDFSDFWDQHQYFSSFQTSLNTLIRQMEALKSDLEQKNAEQEEKRVELQNLQKQKEIQQTALDGQRVYQKVLLNQNESEKKQYEANLTQAEGERRKIIEEILNAEEEVKRLRNFDLYFKSGKIPPPGTKLFVWPTISKTLNQRYGATAFARSGVAGYRFHNGIDIDGDIGNPIYAGAPGKIIGKNTGACANYGRLRNFSCQGGWGNWIAIKHPNELVTLYTHMTQPSSLPMGKEVAAGDTIGFIGSSGNVTGPHLHFSVYTEFFLVPKGYPGYNPEGTLNPLLYL